MNLKELAAPVMDDVISWRHCLHAHPELSGQEKETSAFIEKTLKSFGVDTVRRVGTNNVIALLRGNSAGPVVGLRADCDALPINELSGVEFSSRVPGVMHACGHDIHTSMLLGAARVLCGLRDRIHGTVKFFFQAAEETAQGAREIAEAGELDRIDPPACAAALHVDPKSPAGTFKVRRGVSSASSNGFELTVTGKGGHGAHPDQCIDPIPIAAQVITSLQQLVSREIAPDDPAVVTIGTIHGGQKSNIIASEVVMTGTIRTLKPEVQRELFDAIPRVARLTAQALRGDASVCIKDGTPVLINDSRDFERFLAVAESVVGKDRIIYSGNSSMGSEDFAFFLEKVPGTIFNLGVGTAGTDNAPLHSAHFRADESAFINGVAALTGYALAVCGQQPGTDEAEL